MTRNELKTEAKWAIIEKLEEFAFGCANAKDTFRIYVKSRESELTKRLDELKGVIWE